MKYSTVYTIGCFDQFHEGHKIALSKMKNCCETLVVGIHDDASIEKLKKLSPNAHDSIYIRMANVKQYADRVYIVPDTNPTECLRFMISTDSSNSCYMRANDMVNFPGKDLIEKLMPIEFLTYTQGISSTMIRKAKADECEK